MKNKSIPAILLMTAVALTISINSAEARFPSPPGLPPPPDVNVRVNGFVPAPPGVHVQIDAGRPYYVERDRRVYMERESPPRRHKKYKRHHEDNGRKNGHYKQDRHDRHER